MSRHFHRRARSVIPCSCSSSERDIAEELDVSHHRGRRQSSQGADVSHHRGPRQSSQRANVSHHRGRRQRGKPFPQSLNWHQLVRIYFLLVSMHFFSSCLTFKCPFLSFLVVQDVQWKMPDVTSNSSFNGVPDDTPVGYDGWNRCYVTRKRWQQLPSPV